MDLLRRSAGILFLIFSTSVFAASLSPQKPYYPTSFYHAMDGGLADTALKNSLFEILSNAHVADGSHDRLTGSCAGQAACYQQVVLGYTPARKILFGQIALVTTEDGYGVLDVYCQQLKTSKDFKSRPPGPGEIPDGAILNTEHTWPQSHFSTDFDKEMQKSDLHILYPVLSKANSSRNNLDYGNVATTLTQPCAASKRGYSSDGSKQIYFEVPDVHKGNAARAIFYFSVRYKLPVPAAEQETLRGWNKMDPVDNAESQRNEAIYAAQRERNPFIDYPELVDSISDF